MPLPPLPGTYRISFSYTLDVIIVTDWPESWAILSMSVQSREVNVKFSKCAYKDHRDKIKVRDPIGKDLITNKL